MQTVDMTGLQIGRLKVMERAGSDRRGLATWLCLCECGNKTVVRGADLRSGRTQSCGCLIRQNLQERATHHMTKTRQYKIWQNMKNRCLNPNNPAYKDYGGRGIKICERWANSFENFWNDMKEGYTENSEIDRINNDGNYEPANCRWLTHKQQSYNRRSNRYVDTPWGRITVAELAKQSGVKYDRAIKLVRKGRESELWLKGGNEYE